MQVTLEDVAEAERLVTLLMGDKVEPRRDYITTYADFNKVDTFLAREGKAKVMARKKEGGQPPKGDCAASRDHSAPDGRGHAYLDDPVCGACHLERALPRVEDGLKPVQRRILFTLNELGVTPNKPHKKMRAHCWRLSGQISPAWRQLGLRRDGAHGAAV